MTGRELIIYILQNGLEDELVFDTNSIIGHLSIDQFAVKCGVGHATVYAWLLNGQIDYLRIGTRYFIPATTTAPTDS